MKHWETHPRYVEGCWGCKVTSVQVAATSTPARAQRESDRRFAKDGPAYKRLRAEGLQPPRIDGCAQLEAGAEHRAQIEHGTLGISHDQCKQADTLSRDIGITV
jgi:hypothetical protein